MGIHADFVPNGSEALNQIEKQDYEIILMDCLMPILDGYETTQFFCRREKLALKEKKNNNPDSLVIALTANALKEDREKCLDAGMDDYLSKPIEIEHLASTLNHWAFKLVKN
ncbi:MAG: response regulator [Moorea sp. SIO2B7]|nr:response regulator [Moorena sp. SIO2B7]